MSAWAFVRYLHPHPQPDHGILHIEDGIARVERILLSAISSHGGSARTPKGLALLELADRAADIVRHPGAGAVKGHALGRAARV